LGGYWNSVFQGSLSVGFLRHFNPRLVDIRRVGIAVVLFFSLWTLVAFGFLERRRPLLHKYLSEPGQLTLGTPTYPYVGGYYNSTGYRNMLCSDRR